MTTLAEAVAERTAQGLADLLLLVFDAGVSLGMGIPCARATSASAESLIDTIRERWYQERETAQAQADAPRLPPEQIPAWLREQGHLLDAPAGRWEGSDAAQ